MRAIIVGYPYSGKTTFFDAISGNETQETARNNSNIRNIKVNDNRLKKLRDIFKPKKYTPAEINVLDNYISIADFSKNKSIFNRETQDNLLKSEVTILLIRAFSADNSMNYKETVEPFTDFKTLVEEMCFLDLMATEKRLDRLKKENNKGIEFEIIEKCYNHLQENKPVFLLDLDESDFDNLSGFKFLTQNKILAVINKDDTNFDSDIESIKKLANEFGIEVITINSEIEYEISQLETDEEKLEFLSEYGLSEPLSERFVLKLYEMMGLMSFFTVGPDEVRAWNIKKGTVALKAAGKIHSDIERGFIRAEIIESNLMIDYNGNLQKIKSEGKLRVEGKNCIINDGDIINFRFNV